MYLDKYGAMKIARALAEQKGLSVQFEAEMQPRTDGNRICVQLPDERWPQEKWIEWWGCF